MSQPDAKPRRRVLWKVLLTAAAFALLLLAGLAWYATTDSFQSMIRQRLVAELQRVTGGRVELGSIHTIPFRLQVDVRSLTIHGREAPGEVPYVHVDRLVARIRVISILETEFGFHSIVIDHLVLHIIVYPDGSTNAPGPQLDTSASKSIEQLFALSIRSLEVRNGELITNDQRMPIDFIAADVSAAMEYSLLHRQYTTDLLVGKINTKFADFRPIAWMTEVHFTVGQNTLEVSSLKATTGRSKIHATGRLVNFSEPSVAADYDAAVDLTELGAITGNSQLRDGAAQLNGHVSWSSAGFSSVGKLLAKNFAWREEGLRLQLSSASGQYTVNRQRLAFADIQAKLFGGDVSGSAEINNWLSSPKSQQPKQKNISEQKGSIRLKVKDLSAQEIATALASSARPFQRLNIAGRANGTVETRWRGTSQTAETEIAVSITPPAQVSPSQVPLTVDAHATYRNLSGEWQVDDFRANTRATHLIASGTLSRRASLKLQITTNDLGEWEPLFNASGYQEHSPVSLRGHASFTGTANGKLSDIDFSGKLQSHDLTLISSERNERPQHVMHWDSASANVQLSPETFSLKNGVLHHRETSLHFDAEVGLEDRRFVEGSPFSANLQMQAARLEDILPLVGSSYDGTGKVDLTVSASGTRAQPQGQGLIHIMNAVIHGEPIDRLNSRFSFTGEQLSLQDIDIAQAKAQVTGEGTYDFASDAFRLNLHGDGFNLSRFPELQAGRIFVDGRLEFDAHTSGTFQEPIINAKLLLHDLTFNGELAGDYAVEAVTQRSELRLNGRSQFKDAELDIDGDVHLREQWPATVNLHLNHLDVNPLIRSYLQAPATGPSAVAGDLQLIGPLRDPQHLQVSGNISEFFAEIAHIQVRNNGPVRFTVAKENLEIQQLRLIGQGTDLTVAGTTSLTGDHSIDLRADGHADLALLQSFDPEFTSSGLFSVNVTATGPILHPVVQGRLQLSGGSIHYSDLPSALSDINGSLVFNQDRLQVETLTAHVGGGLVQFGGYATAAHRQLNFDVTLKAQDVRLRYPPGVSSVTNGELRWAGSNAGSILSGDATVTKLAVMPGFDFGSYLARSSQAAGLPQTNPALNRIRIDVHIVTTPELQMQTAAIQLTGDADLHLRGTAAKPVLLGRADIIEGAVYFNGTKYRLERGDVSFSNPVTTTPVLDLQASTKVREYEITLNLNGDVDKLNLSYHSEPPLPTADIISLLALGQTQEQTAQSALGGGSPLAQQATSAVLNEALNSALSNRSQRLFGISHIKIDPQGITAENIPTQTTPLPAVTIEQQVRDNLTLTYTTNVAQTSQQIIQGEYNVTQNVSIVGIRDYNGVVSFEIRLRQRKK